ncbi:MAG TPA: hypothetical protein VLF94_06275 [Chlamydiales bacterium]|nr:hypothetical protein [Chlamydiales bacterium]
MLNVENQIAKVEKWINPFDWVPGISSFSGMIRILAAEVQVVAGVALAVFKMCQIVWTGRGSYTKAMERGLYYSLHGLANIARGCIAMLPIVNISLFVYDRYIGRVNYERETLRSSDAYPLTTAHRLVAVEFF